MCKIAVDVDDTLYSFMEESREQLSLMIDEPEFEQYREQLSHALYATADQWRTPYELCGYDEDGESLWLKCIERCHDNECILAQKPFRNAVDVLCELSDAGHKLLYISNRNTETYEATQRWLIINGFPAGELVVTSENKKPFIKDCQYMIDDRSKTMVEFVYDFDWYEEYRNRIPAMPRKGFMLKTDHNRSLTDVPGLYLAPNWSGLRRYMVKCNLLPSLALV